VLYRTREKGQGYYIHTVHTLTATSLVAA